MSQAHTVESLVDDVMQLVSLPDIYHKLEEAVEDPNMSLQTVADLLGGDPDLTLRLMGIANSCLFGFPAKVDTLGRAVTLIGTRQLRDIVLVTVVVKKLQELDVELIDMDSFWRHSVATGVIARVIATHLKSSNVERYYALGLLHDIGKILLCMKLPQQMLAIKGLQERETIAQRDAEQRMLGFDHAELGGALLETWDLADSMCDVISGHHKPGKTDEWHVDASVIHVADVLANATDWDGAGQYLVPALDPDAWDALGVPSDDLADILDTAELQYRDAIGLLLN